MELLTKVATPFSCECKSKILNIRRILNLCRYKKFTNLLPVLHIINVSNTLLTHYVKLYYNI